MTHPMRWFFNILSALSLLLLAVVLLFWIRSYSRFEGILHFSDAAPLMATAQGEGESLATAVTGRSSGWLSYRGRLTYVSIANPLRSAPWEHWSEPADAPPGVGPMMLVWEARSQRGLSGGTAKTQAALRDPVKPGISWNLPYRYFTLPYWVPALLLLILPYRWIAAHLARRKRTTATPHPSRTNSPPV
jgi:hypothetical protein